MYLHILKYICFACFKKDIIKVIHLEQEKLMINSKKRNYKFAKSLSLNKFQFTKKRHQTYISYFIDDMYFYFCLTYFYRNIINKY